MYSSSSSLHLVFVSSSRPTFSKTNITLHTPFLFLFFVFCCFFFCLFFVEISGKEIELVHFQRAFAQKKYIDTAGIRNDSIFCVDISYTTCEPPPLLLVSIKVFNWCARIFAHFTNDKTTYEHNTWHFLREFRYPISPLQLIASFSLTVFWAWSWFTSNGEAPILELWRVSSNSFIIITPRSTQARSSWFPVSRKYKRFRVS